MSPQLFVNTLPGKTKKLSKRLQEVDFLKPFYLSGGTALALQLGHRESENLDFFSQKIFDPQKFQQNLLTIGELSGVEMSEGMLNYFFQEAQLQFLHYPYKLLEATVDWRGLALSSVVDIACTKLVIISTRGSKKDFVDLFFILKEYSLDELFRNVARKYKEINHNQTHILKSLVYFKEAESQPMPRMHKEVIWDEVKAEVISQARAFKF